MKVVSDENLNGQLVKLLSNSGHEVYEIGLHHQGISDRSIIDLIESWNMPIITEDKDFGELVFAHNLKNVSVIFLWYDKVDLPIIEDQLLRSVDFLIGKEDVFFITITVNKVRITKL